MKKIKLIFFFASGYYIAFSFNWRLIFGEAKLSYSNIFFKRNKKLKFIPTHKPINHGPNKLIDNSGKCLMHYMWVKPKERILLRFETARKEC